MPASLGPGLRTVNGANGDVLGYRQRVSTTVMSSGQRENRKKKLVAAIAMGMPVAEWARANNVPRRTAYRWAKEPKVKSAVEAYRRKAVDQSLGVLTKSLSKAAAAIADLGATAESESVRLSANKAMFSTTITLSKFAALEQRVTELEDYFNAGPGRASCPPQSR
jgi:hypothetical protein